MEISRVAAATLESEKLTVRQLEFQSYVTALPPLSAAIELADKELAIAGHDKIRALAKQVGVAGKVDTTQAGRVGAEAKSARLAAEKRKEDVASAADAVKALVARFEAEHPEDALRTYEKMLGRLTANQARHAELSDAAKRVKEMCEKKEREAAREKRGTTPPVIPAYATIEKPSRRQEGTS